MDPTVLPEKAQDTPQIILHFLRRYGWICRVFIHIISKSRLLLLIYVLPLYIDVVDLHTYIPIIFILLY